MGQLMNYSKGISEMSDTKDRSQRKIQFGVNDKNVTHNQSAALATTLRDSMNKSQTGATFHNLGDSSTKLPQAGIGNLNNASNLLIDVTDKSQSVVAGSLRNSQEGRMVLKAHGL